MSECARCRSKLPPLARFCSECGAWAIAPADLSAFGDVPAAPLASFYAPSPAVPAPAPALLAFAATNFAPSIPDPTPLNPPWSVRPEPATQVSPSLGVSNDRGSFRPGHNTEFKTAEALQAGGTRSLASVPSVAAVGAVDPRGSAFPSQPPPRPPPPRTDAGGTAPVLPDRASMIEAIRASGPPTAPGSGLVASPPTAGDPLTHLPTPARSVLPSSRPLGGFLVSFQYEPLGAFWPLANGPNLLGRVGARPDLDVAINDSTISSEHAIITISRPERSEQGSSPPGAPVLVTLEDRGSRNGTFVNGARLPAGGRAPLAHGDRLRLGGFETVVVVLP